MWFHCPRSHAPPCSSSPSPSLQGRWNDLIAQGGWVEFCEKAGASSDTEVAHFLQHVIATMQGDPDRDKQGIKIVKDVVAHRQWAPAAAVLQHPNLRHCAAACGNLPVLRRLMEDSGDGADVPPPAKDAPESEGGFSLLITGGNEDVREYADLYVWEPVVTCNGRPVWLGLERGKYLYYYRHDDAKDKQDHKAQVLGARVSVTVLVTVGCPPAALQRGAGFIGV